MAKVQITDPEVLREKALAEDVYPATLEDIREDRGSWGKDHPDVQRLFLKFRLHDHPDYPGVEDKMISAPVPVGEGIGDQFLMVCAGLGVQPADFDTEDYIGTPVLLGLRPGKMKDGSAVNNMKSLALLEV